MRLCLRACRVRDYYIAPQKEQAQIKDKDYSTCRKSARRLASINTPEPDCDQSMKETRSHSYHRPETEQADVAYQVAPQRKCEIDSKIDWCGYDPDNASRGPTNHASVGTKAVLCGEVCHNANEESIQPHDALSKPSGRPQLTEERSADQENDDKPE
jgi:hypothetical protein